MAIKTEYLVRTRIAHLRWSFLFTTERGQIRRKLDGKKSLAGFVILSVK